MKKIVILGNSVAGIAAAETIRGSDRESDITVVSAEPGPVCCRHRFGEFCAQAAAEKDIAYRPPEFYQSHAITCVHGKKVTKVDLKRMRIVTEDKEQFPFDILIIADTCRPRVGDITGATKTGVYASYRFSDIKNVIELLPVTETICVQSEGVQGLSIACGLRKRGKDVIYTSADAAMLRGMIDSEPAQIIQQHLSQSGIRVIMNNDITEILGNGDAKALKLKNGKVIAATAIILGPVTTDLKLFADQPLETKRGIVVDGCLRTNIEGVFAVDYLAEGGNNAQLSDDFSLSLVCLEEQGRAVGRTILGNTTQYSVPQRRIAVDMLGLSLEMIGQTVMQQGFSKLVYHDTTVSVYKQLLCSEGAVVGAVLINASADSERCARFARERTPVAVARDILCGIDTVTEVSAGAYADDSAIVEQDNSAEEEKAPAAAEAGSPTEIPQPSHGEFA